MGVRSFGTRGETPVFYRRFRAIQLLPDAIPTGTGIAYKAISREHPKNNRRGLPWPLPESRQPGTPAGVELSTNRKAPVVLLNLVPVPLALLMGLVLLLWSGVPCGFQCASAAGSKRRAIHGSWIAVGQVRSPQGIS